MLKEQNNYKKLFLIKILFFIIFLFVLQKKGFSCERTISYFCNQEKLKNDIELLNCYKNLPQAVYADCEKIIKQKIKEITNKYKNEYIEKDEFIIDNMLNTNCRNETLSLCNGRIKRKNRTETVVVKSKEKCLEKLIKHKRRLTYNCKLTIHNYYNLMIGPMELPMKETQNTKIKKEKKQSK